MKKKLSLLALAAALSPAAFAQSVTVYGIIDLAAEYLSNTAPNGASIKRMPGLSASVPTRLGFRGSEDLGGGLKAIFTIEQGFGADTGTLNQGGRAFGRQSFVGLQGNWGTLTLGRHYTMLFWSTGDADVLGPNAYGISSLDNYFPNARVDNSVSYRGSFSGFQVGFTYSLGRDGVNAGPSPSGTNCGGESIDRQACKEYSLLLKYDTPTWGAAAATDSFKGGTGAFAGLTNSGLKDTRTMVNGYMKFGDIKVGAGYMTRTNDGNPATPKSTLMFLGTSVPVAAQVTLEGEVYQLKFKSSANKASLLAVRANYILSKRTTVYATAGRIDNNGTLAISASGAQAGGTPPAGGGQTGMAAGIRHAF